MGRETDGHLEILTVKQKEVPKNDPGVKNGISNYLEQQELLSSTCSIGTTVLFEACCEDATHVPSFIGCNSNAWSVFSAILFLVFCTFKWSTRNKMSSLDFDKQSTSFQLTSALEQRVLVL